MLLTAHRPTRIERPTSSWVRESHRYNQQCEINEMVLSRAYQPPPLGYHMKRKYDKGDQPSGGETTWANTGATRYGRGQHTTGFGDGMLRSSPNHGTLRLPNDEIMMSVLLPPTGSVISHGATSRLYFVALVF